MTTCISASSCLWSSSSPEFFRTIRFKPLAASHPIFNRILDVGFWWSVDLLMTEMFRVWILKPDFFFINDFVVVVSVYRMWNEEITTLAMLARSVLYKLSPGIKYPLLSLCMSHSRLLNRGLRWLILLSFNHAYLQTQIWLTICLKLPWGPREKSYCYCSHFTGP